MATYFNKAYNKTSPPSYYCAPRKKKVIQSEEVLLSSGMELKAPRPSNDFMFYVDIKTEKWGSGDYLVTSARDRYVLKKR